MSNPGLSAEELKRLTAALMAARRAVGTAKRRSHDADEAAAHAAVDIAKRELGERGEVWWDDGAPDLNCRLARNTVYANWFSALAAPAETLPPHHDAEQVPQRLEEDP